MSSDLCPQTYDNREISSNTGICGGGGSFIERVSDLALSFVTAHPSIREAHPRRLTDLAARIVPYLFEWELRLVQSETPPNAQRGLERFVNPFRALPAFDPAGAKVWTGQPPLSYPRAPPTQRLSGSHPSPEPIPRPSWHLYEKLVLWAAESAHAALCRSPEQRRHLHIILTHKLLRRGKIPSEPVT